MTNSLNYFIVKLCPKFNQAELSSSLYEPGLEKTNISYMQKQKRIIISFTVIAKLISAFFAIRIVQFLYFLNPKFPSSNHLLCLYSSVCVEPFGNQIVGLLMTRLIHFLTFVFSLFFYRHT